MKKHISLFVLLFFSLAFVHAQEDTALAQYKGVYKFKEGSAAPSVEISIQDGALYAASSIGSAAMAKVAKDTFSIPDHNGMIYFSRNSEGRVAFIRVEVGDLVLEGVKEGGAMAIIPKKRLYISVRR
jgi:hypothetical protein